MSVATARTEAGSPTALRLPLPHGGCPVADAASTLKGNLGPRAVGTRNSASPFRQELTWLLHLIHAFSSRVSLITSNSREIGRREKGQTTGKEGGNERGNRTESRRTLAAALGERAQVHGSRNRESRARQPAAQRQVPITDASRVTVGSAREGVTAIWS